MDANSDAELLSSWKNGVREAGQALVERHYRTVFVFFHARLDPDASADLTQLTFATLCENVDNYRGASSFRAYLLGVARWKLVAHFRRVRNRREEPEAAEGDFVPPASNRSLTSVWAARERESQLVEALRMLTLDDQLLLELKEYEGFTAREIAEVLAVPPGTVATRLRRARKLLREHVEQLGKAGLAELTSTTLQEHLREVRNAFAASRVR